MANLSKGIFILINVCFKQDDAFLFANRIAEASQKENLGIIVQYKVRVKLLMTSLGGLVKHNASSLSKLTFYICSTVNLLQNYLSF